MRERSRHDERTRESKAVRSGCGHADLLAVAGWWHWKSTGNRRAGRRVWTASLYSRAFLLFCFCVSTVR